MEGIEDRTGFGGLAVSAMLDSLDQHAAHGPQIGDAGIEIGDLGCGQSARLIPIADGVQGEQLGNLLQCKAQTLRPADESQPVTIAVRIAANRSVMTFRRRQQAAPLVVAHGLNMDPRDFCQFANRYNALGVPIAAGALYPFFGILLSPMIAAAAMSFSSVSVIYNALRLRSTAI